MIESAIVTPWIAAHDDTSSRPGNRPKFEDDYTYIRWSDITGQPSENISPSPNEYTILAEMTEEVFAVLEADADYEILWSETVEEVMPNG